jgi:hypothetical protein
MHSSFIFLYPARADVLGLNEPLLVVCLKVGGSKRVLSFGLSCTKVLDGESSRFISQSGETPCGHWGVFISLRQASTAPSIRPQPDQEIRIILQSSALSHRVHASIVECLFQSAHGDRTNSSISAFQVTRTAEFTAPAMFRSRFSMPPSSSPP